MLLAAAAAAWQVAPLVVVEAGNPVLCGYVYSLDTGLELRVEKGVREGSVFTAVDVSGARSARLTTASFDSLRDLSPVDAAQTGHVRLEGDLQSSDAGGLLFAELGVSGGKLEVDVAGAPDRVATDSAPADKTMIELPAPLPRGVTAMYLNCAGDLIRPE